MQSRLYPAGFLLCSASYPSSTCYASFAGVMFISTSFHQAAAQVGFPGLRIPPASVVESWPKPNYVDPVTHGPALLIVNIVLLSISTIAVAGRLYSRIFIKRWFGVDDAMVIPAYLFAHAMTAIIILADMKYGWNRHVWDIPPSMISSASKTSYAAKILFSLAATCIRLSIICFYYRLVKDSGLRRFRWVLHVSAVCTLTTGITFLSLTIFECSPIRASWIYPPIGHCLNEGNLVFGTGIVNSFLDFLTMVLPIPIIWRLQMPVKQRIGVIILLSIGLIAAVAGVLRVYYTWKSLMDSYDTSWWAYPLWLSSTVEINLGLICACAPACKALFEVVVKRISPIMGLRGSTLRQSSTPKPSLSGKPNTSKSLRNLSRFQIPCFDFQRSRRDRNEHDCGPLHTRTRSKNQLLSPLKGGVKRSEPSEIVLDPVKADPAFYLTKRRSIDQFSVHLREPPRLEVSQDQKPPVAPSHWIWEGSPRKSSYGRTKDHEIPCNGQ